MTPDDIKLIESQLCVSLPERYVHFLLNCTAPGAPLNFHLDVESLVKENLYLRATNYWEKRFFAIGGDGCGNIWCLNLDEPSSAIWIWEHDPPDGFGIEFKDMDELFKAYDA